MKTQLEQLKQELREFIELSKTITQGKWRTQITAYATANYPISVVEEAKALGHNYAIETPRSYDAVIPCAKSQDATFIARSRNISPALAECLLVAVNGLDRLYDDTEGCADGAPDAADHDKLCNEVAHAAKFHLQQILTVWEAGK